MKDHLLKCLYTARAAVAGRPLQFGKIVVRSPFLVCAVWFVLLSQDASGFLLIGAAASLWHELGHIACYLLLFREFPHLTVSLSGIGLSIQSAPIQNEQEALLALAGPLTNFLTAALLVLVLRRRMTVALAAFWAANLLIGGFNLLPIPPLDGYRLLHWLWKFWANKLHFRAK